MSSNDKFSPNNVRDGNENSNCLSSKYNLKELVKLPPREDKNEWIAHNIFDFYKQICMLYGTIREDCTAESCPEMMAGKRYKYLWSYGDQMKNYPVCAADYICRLLDWVQEQLEDEEVFPSKSHKKEFPRDFFETCQTIAKRLLRVYAHIYHHHLPLVKNLMEEPHMNTSFKHFVYFIQEFDLVAPQELEPLKEYVQNLT